MKGEVKIVKKRPSRSKKKTEFAKKYLYLVSEIAEKFKNADESREILEEVGYIGLLNAINLYDKRVQRMDFETYARILISEEIHQYLLDHDYKVDCPEWLYELNQKINEFVIAYREQYKRFPRIAEIADQLNINSSGLQEILKSRDSIRDVYYSHKVNKDLDLSHIQPKLEKIKSRSRQSFLLPIEDLVTLRKAFRKLKALQESIVYYLFVMDLSETKLAEKFGLSSQKAKKIKKEVFHDIK